MQRVAKRIQVAKLGKHSTHKTRKTFLKNEFVTFYEIDCVPCQEQDLTSGIDKFIKHIGVLLEA